MNNELRSVPDAIAITAAKAMSGGTTAPTYIEITLDSASESEKFMPENQFFVLHSHISRNVLYMRVLTIVGARSINKRAPDRLILSANRTSSITSSFNTS